ncbi:MAG: dihydroorotase [Acidimicrobiia bacterium]
MSSLAITDATLVRPDGRSRCTILTEDGVVTALLRPTDRPGAETVIDAGGGLVLPGVIDAHVHLGIVPGFAEACRTESAAAVTGGVTSMWHYLLSPGSFFDVYRDHVRDVEDSSLIDVGFHGLMTNQTQVEEIPRTVDELRLTSYKFHMAMKGPEAAYGINGLDDGLIFEGLRQIASRPGVMALVHAENVDVILRNRELAMAEAPEATDTATWSRHRPHFTEEEAMVRAAILAETAGAPLGVIHTSVGRGPELIRQARVRFPHLYMETCPQYLVLDMEMDLGTKGKVNPPLRTRRDQELLWMGLADGTIDWMGSDHCDYDLASRQGSIWEVGPGLTTGMTMILPVLLSEGVNRGRLTLERVVELTSARFARLMGVSPRKGVVAVGSDADLVMVDLDHEVVVRPEMLNSFADYTPYEGMGIRGWPSLTVAGGEIIYEKGDVNRTTSHRGTVVTVPPAEMPRL